MNNDMTMITLDKERIIRFTNKSMKLIEKIAGCSITKLFSRMDNLTIDEMVTIIYAGLKWDDETLTLSQVDELLEEHSNFASMMKVIADGLAVSMGTENPNVVKSVE